jgi:acyl carrier protein
MDKAQFLAKLGEILELPPGSLTGAEHLSDLDGWDSLAVLGFIALVDEHCGITVAPKRIQDCKTVDDLLALTTGAVSA